MLYIITDIRILKIPKILRIFHIAYVQIEILQYNFSTRILGAPCRRALQDRSKLSLEIDWNRSKVIGFGQNMIGHGESVMQHHVANAAPR